MNKNIRFAKVKKYENELNETYYKITYLKKSYI